MENINETSLHCSLADIEEEAQPKIPQEFDEYIEILTKPADERSLKETEKLATKIKGLGIFEGSFMENMDSKSIIRKLVPSLKYEYFQAGQAIFHYEQPADKLYIICRGKAREFTAKNLNTIEKESRSHYKADPLPHNTAVSLQELPNPATLTSLNTLQENQIKSLVTINEGEEEEKEKAVRSPSSTFKKFRKMKVFFPFLKQMIAQKTATQRINDYSYKQSLRKARSMQRSADHSNSIISPDNLGEEIDMDILEEFKRYPKAYFIGGILKVQFSRYLNAWDYCGLKALQDNALRAKAVIAEEDCHCISLHKDDFLSVMDEEKALNIDKINFFKKLFRKIDETRVVKFALGWEDQTLQMGDVVFQQNEPSDYLYALFRGEIVLSKAASTQQRRSRHVIEELPLRIKKKPEQSGLMKVATLCAGDFFGDSDFFQGNSREFSATVSSARVKILRLSLKKYQETSRSYFDIYREIKTMTGLKLKFNKERFEDLSLQQSVGPTLNGVQNASPNPDKEKILKNIGHYFPSSLTSIPGESNYNEKLQIPVHDLTQTFHHKVESKSWVSKEEGNGFLSLKSSSVFAAESSPKNIFRITGGIENSNKLSKGENRTRNPSIDVSNEGSLLLFSRAVIHRTYTPRHEEMLKKHKENNNEDSSTDLLEPTRRSMKRRTDIISSQPKIVTRYSSIELLKKRVIKNKPNFIEQKAAPQSIPSLDLDLKLNSPDFSNIMRGNQTVCSLNDKALQNGLRGSSVQQKKRRTKPMSSEKLSLVCVDSTVDGTEPNKLKTFGEHPIKVRAMPNCFGPGLLQTGLRCSFRNQEAVASRSLSNIQMLSPKAKDEVGKENSKGFRIIGLKTNSEVHKVIEDKKGLLSKKASVA